MSGRVILAVLLAASSASATTAGFVYTRLVAPRHESAVTVGVGPVQATAPVKTAVVLNASESLFGSLSDSSPDSGAPVCPTATDSHGCITLMRASNVRLKILGYTLTIPPLWLGGDSEDQYAATDNRAPWLGHEFPELFVHPAHLHAHTARGELPTDPENSDSDSGSPQGGSQSGSSNDSANDGSQPAPAARTDDSVSTIVELLTPSADIRSAISSADYDPLLSTYLQDALLPDAAADITTPAPLQTALDPTQVIAPPPLTLSLVPPLQSPAIPEPSTWLMMTAGLGAIGFLRRRRIWAALSMSRWTSRLSGRQGTT